VPGLAICKNGTVSLTASGANSFTWNNTVNSATITNSPSSTTNFFVIGMDNNGCTNGQAITVTVNPVPTLSVTASTNFLCKGATATLSAFGAGSYTWDPVSATGNTVIVTPTVTTTFTVTGSNTFGCLKSNLVAVNVGSITMALSANTTICEGESTLLIAGNMTKASWSNGAIFVQTLVNPSVTTLYTVTGTDIQKCTHTGSVTVNVNANPAITTSANPAVICKGETATLTADGALTYSWSTAATGGSVNLTPSSAGSFTYIVKGIDINGCSSTKPVVLVVDKCTGISEERNVIAGLSVYPNPNNGVFTIELTSSAKSIQVFDVTGRMITGIYSNDDKTVIDLKEVANGVYYVQISSGNQTERVKVIKQ
jgi:hypothetical protein